jgi:hypothetical protein
MSIALFYGKKKKFLLMLGNSSSAGHSHQASYRLKGLLAMDLVV